MKTILVVEDTPGIVEGLQDLLEQEGFHVMTAANPTSALASIAERRPDLIILDLLLPNPGDGWTIVDRLKARPETSTIPILVLSVVTDRTRGVAAGISDYLVKPFEIDDLLARVRGLL